jgi:hypothetical protein
LCSAKVFTVLAPHLQAAEESAERAATAAEAAEEEEDPPLQVKGCAELAKSRHQQKPFFCIADNCMHLH